MTASLTSIRTDNRPFSTEPPSETRETVTLTSQSGRTVIADVEIDWRAGVTFYRVAKFGTLTLSWDPNRYGTDHTDAVHVDYGRVIGYQSRVTLADDAPVVFGVQLTGSAVLGAQYLDKHRAECAQGRTAWFPCRRWTGPCGSAEVLEGTRRRTANIVLACVDHWLAAPHAEALHHAHLRRLAPGRLAEVLRTQHSLVDQIDRLRSQVEDLQPQIAVLSGLVAAGQTAGG